MDCMHVVRFKVPVLARNSLLAQERALEKAQLDALTQDPSQVVALVCGEPKSGEGWDATACERMHTACHSRGASPVEGGNVACSAREAQT